MKVENYIVLTDQGLAALSVEGDTAAFDTLFNRYRVSLTEYVRTKCGSAEDADDIIQETFVKAWLNIHRYNSAYTFGQWIYTIANNTFIDYMRKRRDDLSIDSLRWSRDSLSGASATPTPEDSYINLQRRNALDRYLQRMTPQYRTMIELRFFSEYSYDEIAEKLAMPLGTVKTQIHRAREQLCRFIAEDDIL